MKLLPSNSTITFNGITKIDTSISAIANDIKKKLVAFCKRLFFVTAKTTKRLPIVVIRITK